MSQQRANENQFVFIADEVPEWWKGLSGVLIEVSNITAILPNGTRVFPGDVVTREHDGSLTVTPGDPANQARASEVLTSILLEGRVSPSGDGPIRKVDSERTVNQP